MLVDFAPETVEVLPNALAIPAVVEDAVYVGVFVIGFDEAAENVSAAVDEVAGEDVICAVTVSEKPGVAVSA
jgi:hypothetical protein